MNEKSQKNRKKAVKFKITELEGTRQITNLFKGREARSWEKIDSILTQIAFMLGSTGIKTFITITFEDGKEYQASYYLEPIRKSFPNLREHVCNYAMAYAGLKKPPHLSKEQYQQYLAFVGNPMKDYTDLLENYEILPQL